MRITHTLEVDCPPARLWPFLENPDLQREWMKGLLESHPTSEGFPRVGYSFRMRIEEGGRIREYSGQVTAHEPPHHLGVSLWGGSFQEGMVMRIDYRLTALDGRTRLDYVADLEPGRMGWFLRLLLPFIKLFGKAQLRASMRRLRRLAELRI